MFSARFLAAAAAASLSLISSATADYDKNSIANVAMYYGNGPDQLGLAHFCNSTSVDIIPIGFINIFPPAANGLVAENFGNQCWPEGNYTGPGYNGVNNPKNNFLYNRCPYLQEDIYYCQTQTKKKILLSLGGDSKQYQLNGAADGIYLANFLWGAYGPYNASWVKAGGVRPLDRGLYNTNLSMTIDIDGFDFDIEHTSAGSLEGYIACVKRLHDIFDDYKLANPCSKDYLISGAPQCPIPDANMGALIANAKFDLIWVQFYNNGANGCTARNYSSSVTKPGGFNFNKWVNLINSGASAGAKVYMGLLGSDKAGNSSDYIYASEAKILIDNYHAAPQFGGIMLWEATYAENNNAISGYPGLNYYQVIKSFLKPYAPTVTSTTTVCSKTSTSSSRSSTKTSSSSSKITSSSSTTVSTTSSKATSTSSSKTSSSSTVKSTSSSSIKVSSSSTKVSSSSSSIKTSSSSSKVSSSTKISSSSSSVKPTSSSSSTVSSSSVKPSTSSSSVKPTSSSSSTVSSSSVKPSTSSSSVKPTTSSSSIQPTTSSSSVKPSSSSYLSQATTTSTKLSSSSSGASSSSSVVSSSKTALGEYTSSSTSTSSSAAPTGTGCYYLGCYSEATGIRALSGATLADFEGMTVEKCQDECSGYALYGVEYGGECYCGNELNLGSVIKAEADCNMPCAGDASETCGGPDRLNVYSCGAAPLSSSSLTSSATSTSSSSVSETSTSSSTTESSSSSSEAPVTSSSSSSSEYISSTASSSSSYVTPHPTVSYTATFSYSETATETSSSSAYVPSSSSTSSESVSSTTSSTSEYITPTYSNTFSYSFTESSSSSTSSESVSSTTSSSSEYVTPTYSNTFSYSFTESSSASTSSESASSTTSSASEYVTPTYSNTFSYSFTESSSSSEYVTPTPSSSSYETTSTASSESSSGSAYVTPTTSSSSAYETTSSSYIPSSTISGSVTSSSSSVYSTGHYTNSNTTCTSTASSFSSASSSEIVTIQTSTPSSSKTYGGVTTSSTSCTSSHLSSKSSGGEVTYSSKPTTTSESTTEYTTSTIYSTSLETVTSCAPTVTNCPVGSVVTKTIAISTTICPVTATETGKGKPTTTPASSASVTKYTTSTVYTTSIYTITSCAPSVTDCPSKLGHVTTEIIKLYTTVCPVTEAEATKTPTPKTLVETPAYTGVAVPSSSLPGGEYDHSTTTISSTTTQYKTVKIVKSTATIVPLPPSSAAPYPTGPATGGYPVGTATGAPTLSLQINQVTSSAEGVASSSSTPSPVPVYTTGAASSSRSAVGMLIAIVAGVIALLL